MTAARDGDRDATEALLRRHHERIAALCRRMMGADDAPDATQEALIAIVAGLEGFDGRSAFSTWCYRVTTNRCLDLLRRRRPTESLDAGPGPPADPGPPVAGTVADRLDVENALARLPEAFRAPVVLRDLCQLDYAEIAEVLDLAPGTVRSRIARGRGALAADLDPAGNQAGAPDRRSGEP